MDHDSFLIDCLITSINHPLVSSFAHAADLVYVFSPVGIEVPFSYPQVRDQVLRGICALCATDLLGTVLDSNSPASQSLISAAFWLKAISALNGLGSGTWQPAFLKNGLWAAGLRHLALGTWQPAVLKSRLTEQKKQRNLKSRL